MAGVESTLRAWPKKVFKKDSVEQSTGGGARGGQDLRDGSVMKNT